MQEDKTLILRRFIFPTPPEERPVANDTDQDFYNRADAVIELANSHICLLYTSDAADE